MPAVALTIFRYLIALAYAFGGAMHVANLSGFGPPPPPGKERVFRALDVAYLLVNALVVIGVTIGATWGYAAFFAAAGSQLVLYLGFTDYFASDADQRRQLRSLVHFHLITATVMATLLLLS